LRGGAGFANVELRVNALGCSSPVTDGISPIEGGCCDPEKVATTAVWAATTAATFDGIQTMPAKKSRKAIGPKLRFEIFKRDGFTCQYCGAHPPNTVLQVDHIDPVANGGDNDQYNLITSCDQCNGGKGARLLSNAPMSLAEKAKQIAESERQLKGYNKAIRERRKRMEEDAWEVADVFMDRFCQENDRAIKKMNFRSILIFLEKMPLHEVVDAMEKATDKIGWSKSQCFRYFCGICWKKIKEETP